jgi:hypothetical protein
LTVRPAGKVRAGGIAPPARPRQTAPARDGTPADVRLDGDQVTADPDDGDAGDYSRTYIPPRAR